jgi:hypothetical protein
MNAENAVNRESAEKMLYARYELVTTFLWFGLDASWLFEWRLAADALAAAAIVAALLTLRHAERNAASQVVAWSLFGWVLMNAFWVTGDLNGQPWLVNLAKVCTGFVIVCLVVAAIVARGRPILVDVLRRFRRIRF